MNGRILLPLLAFLFGCPSDAPPAMDMTPVLDLHGRMLFVAQGSRGSVAVIDIDQWRVVAQVALSDHHLPHHLGLSPDRRYLSVAAPADDATRDGAALYTLDTVSGQIAAQAMAGGTAQNLAFLPDGKTVVWSLLEQDHLAFADAATLMRKDQAAVDQEPWEATVLPDGKILVAGNASNTVAMVDPQRHVTIKSLKVCNNPTAAWPSPAGDRAYVTCEGDRRINVIDVAGMQVVAGVFTELPGMPGQAATTTDGQYLYVAIASPPQVQVMKAADLSVVAQIEVGQTPHGLAADPDGQTMYLTDEAGQVHALDVATRKLQKSLSVAGTPQGIVFRSAL